MIPRSNLKQHKGRVTPQRLAQANHMQLVRCDRECGKRSAAGDDGLSVLSFEFPKRLPYIEVLTLTHYFPPLLHSQVLSPLTVAKKNGPHASELPAIERVTRLNSRTGTTTYSRNAGKGLSCLLQPPLSPLHLCSRISPRNSVSCRDLGTGKVWAQYTFGLLTRKSAQGRYA